MSGKRYTFDTNILFYALDADASDKYQIALDLLGSASTERAIILLQTFSELYYTIGRKRPQQLAEARRWIERTSVVLDVESALPVDLYAAIGAQEEHNLQFWDAMLWATARRAGCTLLLSEDFQDGRMLDGVLIRNPFRMSQRERDELLRDR